MPNVVINTKYSLGFDSAKITTFLEKKQKAKPDEK
jgi:hypothetical protein